MDRALADAADWNYCQANVAFMGNADPGEALETPRVHLTSCGVGLAEFNKAFLKAPIEDAPGALRRAEAFFGERGLPFCVELRSDLEPEARPALGSAGYREAGRTPAMCLAPLRRGPPPPPDLRVEEAREPEAREAFRATAFAGFGLPAAAAPRYLGERLLSLPHVRAWLGRVEGRPVATALLLATAPVAGIYWVATLEGFRGRGYGAALTWAALEAGLEGGCAWGSLQASALGRPVYARMGFATPFHYVRFDPPSSPPARPAA